MLTSTLRNSHATFSRYDFNAKIGKQPPEPFVDNHLDVGTQQCLEGDWAQYAHAALSVDAGKDPGLELAALAHRSYTDLIELERDEYDLPLLPPLRQFIKTDKINNLIQSFLAIHYGESMTNPESF